MMQMATPHFTSPAPPMPGPSPTQALPQALLPPPPTSTPGPSPTPQPPVHAIHPAPASIPTSAPTSSPKSPAQPSWADLSQDLAPPSQFEELPTLLPKRSRVGNSSHWLGGASPNGPGPRRVGLGLMSATALAAVKVE